MSKNQIFLDLPMSAQSLQSCPSLCNSMDYSLPGSSVLGILQVSTLEWAGALLQGIFLTQELELLFPVSNALKTDSLPVERTNKGN